MDKPELALADFEQAIVLNPSRSKYHYFKGRACASLDRHQETLKAFISALENYDGTLPIDDLYQKKALAHLTLGDSDMAMQDFENCLSKGGDPAVCHYYLGCIHTQMGDYVRAIWHYDQGIQVKPEDIGHYYSRAVAYQRMDRHDQAIDDLSFVISRDSHDAQAYYQRGTSFSSINHFQQAIEDYSHAIELAPDMVEAYCDRAVALFEIDELEKAFTDVEEAIRRDGTNEMPYITRACLLLSRNKPEEALADLAAAEVRDPENTAINMIRAEAHKQLKQESA